MHMQTIIQKAIPNATEEFCEWLIWERTAFPFKPLTARELYKTASRVKRAKESQIRLCDLCDRIAEPGEYLCCNCKEVLKQ